MIHKQTKIAKGFVDLVIINTIIPLQFAYSKTMGFSDTDKLVTLMEQLTPEKNTIIQKFKGGPVGITTIATAVGENGGTLEEVYEPYLIQEGYLMRTARGRVATEKAYTHIGVKYRGENSPQTDMFDL